MDGLPTTSLPIFEPREGQEEPNVIYCNQVRVGMSVWDIVIDIGQAAITEMHQGAGGQMIVPVDYKTRIVMSPQHAKALSQVLAQNVQQYESIFGEVSIAPRVPPERK